MRLSTKGRYAVTAMLTLAIHEQPDTVTLADISRCQGISLSYLEQLFSKLRKHQLVEGVRGPGGGYRLARRLDEITVAQIITAVDEREEESAAANVGSQRDQRRLTHELWDELSGRLYDFLNGITLAEFVNRAEVREQVRRLGRSQGERQQMDKRSAA
jgi:Rrf2 family iron-sulfur cluster assembly transcriptional regulator